MRCDTACPRHPTVYTRRTMSYLEDTTLAPYPSGVGCPLQRTALCGTPLACSLRLPPSFAPEAKVLAGCPRSPRPGGPLPPHRGGRRSSFLKSHANFFPQVFHSPKFWYETCYARVRTPLPPRAALSPGLRPFEGCRIPVPDSRKRCRIPATQKRREGEARGEGRAKGTRSVTLVTQSSASGTGWHAPGARPERRPATIFTLFSTT
jgi:hypothetical protein